MSLTVRQRIEGQAAAVVGRESERAVLCQLLSADRPLVVFIHGIAGVGKSALIETFSGEARAGGAIVLRLDCGEIEPTERGFLAALSGAIGGDLQSVDEAATRLASLGDRIVTGPRQLRGLSSARPLAAPGVRPGPERPGPDHLRGPRAADDRLAEQPGRAVP